MGVNTRFDEDHDSSMQSGKLAPLLTHAPKKAAKVKVKTQSSHTSGSSWKPLGHCRWRSSRGEEVLLQATRLQELSKAERTILQQLALAKLQSMDLGCKFDLPRDDAVADQKPKRRAILLRRKAATTSALDGKDLEKDPSHRGLVFGISLGKCIENDRLRQRRPSSQSVKIADSRIGDVSETGAGHAHKSKSAAVLTVPVIHEESVLADKETTEEESSKYLTQEPQVPHIVTSCCAHLQTHGLHTVGIFRVSSSKKRVRQLREEFDSGREVCLEEEHQPHDVAVLLKEYFREMPEPLLTRDLYAPFLATQRIPLRPRQVEALRLLIRLLPLPHADTLGLLLPFLHTVSNRAADTKEAGTGKTIPGNRMDSHNLAMMFGPNVLRKAAPCPGGNFLVDDGTRPEERSDVIITVRSLIDNHQTMFEVAPEELDAVYLRLHHDDPKALDLLIQRQFHVSGKQPAPDLDLIASMRISKGVEQSSSRYQVPLISITADGKSGVRPLAMASCNAIVPDVWQRSLLGTDTVSRPYKIEKCASASVIQSSLGKHRKPEGRRGKDHGAKVATPETTNQLARTASDINLPTHLASARRCSKPSVKFQNERWKRREIIASEYTEHGK